jgi:GGDEF domain-containing protein
MMWEGIPPPPAPPSGALVVGAELFRLLLELEVPKAQRLRYCLSVVCLKGQLASEDDMMQRSLAAIVASRIRATDVALDRGPDGVALLLIDADVTVLPTILRRIITDFETVPWSAGVASYPKSTNKPGELLAQADSMLLQAERDGGSGLRP